MSIKNNPLSDQQEERVTAYGTVTPLIEHDKVSTKLVQAVMFLLLSFIGGVKMIGTALILLFGGMAVLGILLGIPVTAFQAIIDGQYILGSIMTILSLTIYGAVFNELL